MLLILIVFLGFLLGLTFVQYLTVHPLKIELYLTFTLILTSLTVFLLLLQVITDSNIFLSSLTGGIAFFIGYFIRTRQVMAQEDTREYPNIERSKEGPVKGHTAIIYLTHGEPETYNPIGWINQFREFDELKTPFIPFLLRPIFIYKLRRKYLKVGRSNHKVIHKEMLESLVREFRLSNDTSTKFYLAFLDDEPRPEAAVIQALNEGASNIIISFVFVSFSSHTLEGKEVIKSIKPEDYGVSLKFTQPLWDSSALHKMFLEKSNTIIKNREKSKVGILLVGHGQPEEWDEIFPLQTKHE
ncbi:MAG: hypothetical protein ACXAAT_19890, partial [Candidatus Hodarchaeales archaeon]